jgi:hypothetical protein
MASPLEGTAGQRCVRGESAERTNMPRLEPVTIAVRFDIAVLEL